MNFILDFVTDFQYTGVLIIPQPDQEENKLQRQKILIFIYPIYNHNWGNIGTIYTYNKTSIKRNILTIKQIHWEVGRAKDLSAPLCLFSSLYHVSLEMPVDLKRYKHRHHPLTILGSPNPCLSERYLFQRFVTSVLLPNNIDFTELICLLWIQLFNGKAKLDDIKGTCRDSSVSRVEYDLDDRGIVFRFPIEKIFLFRKDYTVSRPHRVPIQSVPAPHPPGCGNGGLCEADHSPSLPAKRKLYFRL